jgi:hypothetical protein
MEKSTDTLEIWTLFSKGNFVNLNAERIVEKKWPFKIKGIAGDVFPEELMDSVDIHNKRVWNYLDAHGYVNSQKEFETELVSEIKRIKKAVDIANADKRVKALIEKWRKDERLNYTELNKLSDVKYEFLLFSFEIDGLPTEHRFELKYIADLDTVK